MARAIYYPKANRTAQWYGGNYRGSDITPNVMVWHTTEVHGWPSYGRGASMPHLTYDPVKHQWRQHMRLDRSARALRNASGGVETNTLNACQVEIVAYSDEGLALSRGAGAYRVSRLDARALRDLGDFSKFMFDEWGLKLDIDPGWLYSNFNAPPMSFSQWRNFYGHTGHNRVPENTHWDPGKLDIKTIIANAKGQEDDDVRPSEWNKADKKAVADAVWNTDGVIKAPSGYGGTNKYWMGSSVVRSAQMYARRTFKLVNAPIDLGGGRTRRPRWLWKWAYQHSGDVKELIEAQKPLLEAAAEGRAMSADEVQQVATASAAAVPKGIAEDVMDEFEARLSRDDEPLEPDAEGEE